MDRTKKMAAYIENSMKILKDTSDINAKITSKKPGKCPEANGDDDLSHFEQMVIKKKNPYLDLKEFDMKYYFPKNTRQNLEPGLNFEEDPTLCESLEDKPIVEITNRGLSGFSIPTTLLKKGNETKTKIKSENPPSNDSAIKKSPEILKKQADHPSYDPKLLSALEDDIRQFEEIYL